MNSLVDDIFQLLVARHETLAVAESCTGGGLAHEITKRPGISQVFLGSITSYANDAKINILQIPHQILARHGAVSEQIALLMAQNCRQLFSATWALSTTGIAGPSGATAAKPVGLVYVGLAGPDINLAQRFIFTSCTRLEHREKTIAEALLMLKDKLMREN